MTKQKDFKIIYLDDDYAKIRGNCRVTGSEYQTKKFPIVDYIKYQSGKLIQESLPDLSADDREFIISGTTPKAWDVMFENQQDLKLKW
tara:strand:+ start:5036 stop:5299 length:264 start_codon:yes stop_codon:yes gene_type:complete